MHPLLLEIGKFKLPAYGALLVGSFLLSAWLLYKEAERRKLPGREVVDTAVVAFLFGILGAKILLILVDLPDYIKQPSLVLGTLQSAGVIYGGLIGGLLGVAWYMRRHKLPPLKTLDTMAPFVALGTGLGRLACVAAGCCYGFPYEGPLALVFPEHPYCEAPAGVSLFPVQLVGLATGIALCLILLSLLRRKHFPGQIILAFAFLYSLTRGLIELLRGDTVRGLWFGQTLSTSQLIAIGVMMLSVVLYLKIRKEPSS